MTQNFSRVQLKREDFQANVNGKQTDLIILKNAHGTEAAFTNYGGFLVAMMVPDKKGNYADVVLGHSSVAEYQMTPEPYLGAIIGRYGNRIAKGKFTLDGVEYSLAINNGPNNLHGGVVGFNKKVWDIVSVSSQKLVMSYVSVDGEEGFPGTLMTTVTFTLTDDDAVRIDYRATTDKATIVNLTQHSFFNLAGTANPSASVCNNVLTINADHYTPSDDTSIPFGTIEKVEGTPMDFRTPHVIGERIEEKFNQLVWGKGYDHCYVLNKKYPGELTFAAKVLEPASGRTLEVYTTEPGVQLYTGNWLSGFAGKYGATYPERSAVCLETQHFPDSPNKPQYPSCVLRPGEVYTHTCIYKFGVEK